MNQLLLHLLVLWLLLALDLDQLLHGLGQLLLDLSQLLLLGTKLHLLLTLLALLDLGQLLLHLLLQFLDGLLALGGGLDLLDLLLTKLSLSLLGHLAHIHLQLHDVLLHLHDLGDFGQLLLNILLGSLDLRGLGGLDLLELDVQVLLDLALHLLHLGDHLVDNLELLLLLLVTLLLLELLDMLGDFGGQLADLLLLLLDHDLGSQRVGGEQHLLLTLLSKHLLLLTLELLLALELDWVGGSGGVEDGSWELNAGWHGHGNLDGDLLGNLLLGGNLLLLLDLSQLHLLLLSLVLDQSELDGSGGLDGLLLLLLLLSVLGDWGPLEHGDLLHLLAELLGGHGGSWELLLITLLHQLLSGLVELSAELLLHGHLHLLDLCLLANYLGQLLDGQLLLLLSLLILLLLLLKGQLNLGDGQLLQLDQWLSDLEGLSDLLGLDR